MARPKKDPAVRRTVFMEAAQWLFFSKGYAATSVQDILQEVGDKSVSPSVFYYYFSSKEGIYQTVMESYCEEYVAALETCFNADTIPLEERFLTAMRVFTEKIAESRNRVDISDSLDNRLFALDLRDRTTRRIAGLMEAALERHPLPGTFPVNKRHLSIYITAGIGELANRLIFDSNSIDTERIYQDIITMTSGVLGVPKAVLKRFTKDKRKKR